MIHSQITSLIFINFDKLERITREQALLGRFTSCGFPLGASSSLFSLLAVCAVPLPFVNSHGGLDSSDGYRSYWRVQNFLTRERIAIQNSRSASACAARPRVRLLSVRHSGVSLSPCQ